MNARQIEVFRAVMRAGTLTAAAKELNVSQPALSQLLLHAEDQLGFRLFSRVQGRLIPTPEGIQMYPEADRLHQDLERLRRLALDIKEGKTGTLRFATSTPPALSFVPRALQEFQAATAGIRLISHVVPMAVLADMLRTNQAEMGVAMNDTPQPQLRTERIGQSQIICLLPSAHQLVTKTAVTPADLLGESLITYHPDNLPGTLLSQAFAAAGALYNPQIEIDVSIAATSFVQQGFGVALVDNLVPWNSFSGLVTRPFLPKVVLPVCLLVSTRRPLSSIQKVLRQSLKSALSKYALPR